MALIRDEKGTGHLKLAREADTACSGKMIPVLEARAYYERQIAAAKAGTGDQKQLCQFQIELTRGHKMEDQETYGNILNEAGPRPKIVESINPATVPEGQVVYAPGSREP
ncbi:MAG: hypothetical protein ACK5XZ_03845 [Hyphomonadaceae bacterium]|uniref:hypothetical protein n=1 Tax=Aquidulcibacter sp. TaxID=2052990 RepID=UPI0022BFC833|nr:hypothetical protein [Aquidulcibacter sp.]MCE2889728.1 hypothetical protein [Hyphomonadaceae bacterium]MCZ8209712.1 hypothetical protein [Aquidulcibacter sp.]